MANIQPTRFTTDTSGRKRPERGTTWKVRYRSPDGDTRSKTFDTKADAERFAAKVETTKAAGDYVDPSAGRVTVMEYAEEWRTAQVHRASTAEQVETNLRRHVYPTFGHRALASIRPTEVQAWVRGRGDVLAPATVELVYRLLAAVMLAAVRDRLIACTPCDGIRLPKAEPKRFTLYTVEQVAILLDTIPEQYRALLIFAAGSGLRQGECFGVTVDRLDFLRDRSVTVDRQLVMLRGEPAAFGPLKTRASYRSVPLNSDVLDVVADHLRRFGPGPDGLVFTDSGKPIRRTSFSAAWRPAAIAAGIPSGEAMHGLRHFYASALIAHGRSPKEVQSRLGHATITETMDTYGHLWPDSEDGTRAAMDSALGGLLRGRAATRGVLTGSSGGHDRT